MFKKLQNQKQKRLSLSTRHSLYGYVFTAPFALGFILFFLTPFLLYISMSFSDMSMSDNGIVLKFAGLAYNKITLADSTSFLVSVGQSLGSMVFSLPAVVIYSFFIANLLNKKFVGRTFFRAAFFLPVVIASGVNVLSSGDSIAQNAINAVSGIGSASGDTLNLAGSVVKYLGPDYVAIVNKYIQPIISNIYTVTSSGVQILIFLAALQTISPSIYEAANIDGATAWEAFWKITFPYLSPIIVVNAVYTLVDMLGSMNNKVVMGIYDLVARETKFSESASRGVFYFTIIFILMGLMILVLSRLTKNAER